MKKPRTIVLIYSGEAPTPEVLATIAANIGAMCKTDQVDPFVFEPEEMAKAMISAIGKKTKVCTESSLTMADKAAIFIWKRMKDSLGTNYTQEHFILELLKKIGEAKSNKNNKESKAFINALFILSQPNLEFSSKEILRDCHLNEDRIAIIRDTYKFIFDE